MDSQIELYPHNQTAYDKLCKMLEVSDRACVVQPTGTGKFVIIAKLVQDNPKMRFLLLGTNEYMFADQMANLADFAPGFTPENLQFMTYAAAMVAARNEVAAPKCDVIIADEFHHCGAPEWGKGVQYVIESNPEAKVIGFTATPIRYSDNGRNMADEMFEGNVASSMELEEAWLRGILPIPKYIIALYDAPKELGELKVSIDKVHEKKKHSKFVKKYEELRRSLQDADGIDRIIAKHLKKRDGKVIVFCPREAKLNEFMLLSHKWFGEVNDEIHVYKTTSKDPYASLSFKNFKADDSSALKVLYCINQLNEAVHVKGIDEIVMVRPTKSPVIFHQQLGRALSSGGNQAPVVFDLCNNFGLLGGISVTRERMRRAYKSLTDKKVNPLYTPRDFKVIDAVKDSRSLAKELQQALHPQVDADERISILEQAVAVGAVETDERGYTYTSHGNDFKNIKESLRRLWREGKLTKEQEQRLVNLGFEMIPMTKRSVVCYETGELFESVADAARAIGVHKRAISISIENHTASGGYHWYYETDERPTPDSFKRVKDRKAVVCVETGEVFDSTGVAAYEMGLTISGVSKSARSGQATKGFHFHYIDDSSMSIRPSRTIPVICVETGKKYDSITDAAIDIGQKKPSNIIVALKSGGRAGGYHWRFADVEKPVPPFKKERWRAVMCCETGEIFRSACAAARSMGFSASAVWSALKRGGTSGGYHWKYVDSGDADETTA